MSDEDLEEDDEDDCISLSKHGKWDSIAVSCLWFRLLVDGVKDCRWASVL